MTAVELKLLLIEDSGADADLVIRSLRSLDQALAVECVADEAGLRESLARRQPDVVLSDFSMPGFNGRVALSIVREIGPDIPFIFVSGTIGEELAIEALQEGAADYVLKDNLRRLPAAVERALRTSRDRRLRQNAERALRESEERFRAIVETTEDWIWETDSQGLVRYSNPGVARLLGIPIPMMIGRDPLDFVLAEDREDARAQRAQSQAQGVGWRNRLLRWRHRDGSLRILESSAQVIPDPEGGVAGFRGIDRDATQRIELDQKVRQLARIHAVLGALGNAILRADDRRSLLDLVCRLAVEQGGFAAALIVESPQDSVRREIACRYGDDSLLKRFEAALADATGGSPGLAARRHVVIEAVDPAQADATARAVSADRAAHTRITVPLGGEPWGLLILHSRQVQTVDADEIALLERLGAEIDHALDFIAKGERLEYLAYHNSLTGLPNRTAFRDLLSERLSQAPLVVALVDVAHFHNFNDSRGREFSDELLRAIGTRLAEPCGSESMVAQIGDELFALVLSDIGSPDESIRELEQMLERSSQRPLLVRGEEVYVDFRCGVLQAPRHGVDAEAIERNALSALAEARNRALRIVSYSEDLGNRAQTRLLLERDLRHALDAEEFELFLQPKFNARTSNLTGVEALLRWRHPERGLVSPADFIPVLEDTGLIVPAGRWIMRKALEISARWRAQGHGGLRIAINISARELRQSGFVADCAALLDGFDSDHGLDIELTESLLMDDITRSIHTLQALRDLGCMVSIDDFGTGYSSLNYLSRLPADVLKIDRSFIAELASSPESLALVTNIIGLAHSLGLTVVAEGVEEEEQAKLLRLLRCDELQGYLLGRPLPIDEFERQFIA